MNDKTPTSEGTDESLLQSSLRSASQTVFCTVALACLSNLATTLLSKYYF